MSRSVRKKPIMGITTCRSEKQDKQIWHKRWRRRERIALAGKPVEVLEDHLTSTEKEAVKVWSMGKESRQRWPLHRQAVSAQNSADRQGRSPQERAALCKRLLHKWVGK